MSSAPSASAAPESGDIGRPEALLPVAMEDRDEIELAASRSAISPVPSGELSSITSTFTPSGSSACTIASRFSRSLYVGKHTVAFGIAA